MKKTMYALMAIALLLGFAACQSTAPGVKDTVQWEGTYTGLIPAADGPGIHVRLGLRQEGTFELYYQYVDRKEGTATWTGNFVWDSTGNIVILEINGVPPYYRVGNGTLTQLDMKGRTITGSLAKDYVLKKSE